MALDVFLTSTEVTLSIDLVDDAGNALNVDAVQYRVVNQDGAVVVPLANLTTFAAGDPQATVIVAASVNAMATGNTREIRSVELVCETESGTLGFAKSYGLETLAPLVTGANSFQSFPMAELTAMDMPNLGGWDGASEQDKVRAMIDAREHICQLNFNLLNSNANFGQDQLAYVPEGQYQSSYVAQNSLFIFNGDLGILNETQFAALPERFKKALRQAQLAEANAILGGESNEARRQSGIIEDEIGESRQRYRDSKPLQLPVSRRALGYLSGYVTFSKRIGRAG
jgi:hypothetical protein